VTALPRKLVRLLQDWDRERVELEQTSRTDVDHARLRVLVECLDELRAALNVPAGDLRYVGDARPS